MNGVEQSKISICNLALASVGSPPIKSFNEDNKRARMCQAFYEHTSSYLLSKFDWPFARAFARLSKLDYSDEQIPFGGYAYQLPNDCRTPRDLHPYGSRDPWQVIGNVLFCEKSENVGLYYTKQNIEVQDASTTFANLTALGIGSRIALPLSQDKDLARVLMEAFTIGQAEAWESDANIGNIYPTYDGDPNNDTFVNTDLIHSYLEKADANT